jgi:hypothetical protein
VGICCRVAAQQLGLPAALTTESQNDVPIRIARSKPRQGATSSGLRDASGTV